MTLTNLQKAEQERSALETTINAIEKMVISHSTAPITQSMAASLVCDLSDAQKELKDINKRIFLCQPSDIDPHTQAYQKIYEKIINLSGDLGSIESKFPRVSAAATAATTASHEVKLPRLEIPSFGGDPAAWIGFRDMFTATVDKKSSISKVEKLTYLKGLLQGEPARLISHFSINEMNYDLAWKALVERYENEREQFFSVLNKFYGQPQVNGSVSSIRSLLDTTKGCIQTFTNLKGNADHLFVYTLFTKMDHVTKELWFQSNDATKIPKLDQVYKFLEQRALALSAGSSSSSGSSSSYKQNKQPPRVHNLHLGTQQPCGFQCSDVHKIYRCKKFIELTPQKRSEFVKSKGLCYNCLSEGHTQAQCKSTQNCKLCSRKHNTMLHFPNQSSFENTTTQSPQSGSEQTTQNHYISDGGVLTQRLLATAVIKVQCGTGSVTCRALIDSGSGNSFITKRLTDKLALIQTECSVGIVGLSSCSVGRTSASSEFTLITNEDRLVVQAYILPNVTSDLPSNKLNPKNWPHLQNLQLADPNFHVPAPVDVLIGTDVFWYILRNGIRRRGPDEPVAVNTTLGWLIGGNTNKQGASNSVRCYLTNFELNQALEKFWNDDSAPDNTTQELTVEETDCEAFVNSNLHRVNGKFVCPIPWKQNRPSLGESRQRTVQQWKGLERRFKMGSAKNYKEEYNKFMVEYEEMGHMTKIPKEEVISPRNPTYYIPHHFVLKLDSTTTKLRVVFNASMKTSNKLSLNDIMMKGPVIQPSLFVITLRFRTNEVAYTADIAKMYRNIMIPDADADLHRTVFRANDTDELSEYRLKTITYGTTAASYCATKCLSKLADEEEERYPLPLAAPSLRNDFYMDDLQGGDKTPEQAIAKIKQLIEVCANGNFPLRKWTCNNTEVLATIPEDLREKKELFPVQEEETVKTLGIHWHPREDNYRFKITLSHQPQQNYTKRIVASEMAKIFDPIGWLAPVTVKGKLILQDAWKSQRDWDKPLPEHVQQQWSRFKQSLHNLEKIRIPRFIIPHRNIVQLIGFCDSSLVAYSAVIYVYCQASDLDEPTVTLVTSKTRIASLKAPTLPRLELCGAVLLAELMTTVTAALNMDFNNIKAYSDSTIALSWINSDPNKWQQYVRNRVIKIQNCRCISSWEHVPGEENPADCASRGLYGEELVNHHLWFQGNTKVLKSKSLPKQVDLIEMSKEERVMPVFCHTTTTADPSWEIMKKFSSLRRLLLFTAFILRAEYKFLQRKQNVEERKGKITTNEIKIATAHLILLVQNEVFKSERSILSKGHQLPVNSKLLSLHPQLNKDNLLCVGGRLRHAQIMEENKHQVILPRYHHFTTLVLRDAHEKHFHAGQQSTLAIVMQRYWIIRGKDAVNFVIKRCVQCSRMRGSTLQQIMGDLPKDRVNPAPCFQKCGIDYAGPFSTKNPGRSNVVHKSYLAVFVCFTTKAIHLELATSLSTDCFMAAFRRFTSRRGKPADVHTDCGTNFVGAQREIYKIQLEMSDQCIDDAITWHFNPPGASHFGGLWEAGVKSVKFHLNRIMGSSVFTYEEMLTMVTQIEAVLNSRPLSPLSNDPSDLSALTPGHFLIGRPLNAFPDYDYMDLNMGRLDRWQLIQQKQQQFWKRWQMEYISRMQTRPKWMKQLPPIQLNDVVIIKEENLPPGKWKLGRVTATHPGADDVIRVVTLQTQGGILKRPIHKLCLLPVNE